MYEISIVIKLDEGVTIGGAQDIEDSIIRVLKEELDSDNDVTHIISSLYAVPFKKKVKNSGEDLRKR